jgi:hypothetical protein
VKWIEVAKERVKWGVCDEDLRGSITAQDRDHWRALLSTEVNLRVV